MDMNKSYNLTKELRNPAWIEVDATDQVLGRLATQIASMLRGKDKPFYTPFTDSGDYVIVVNAEKVRLTGDKWESKMYLRHSGWIGGLKQTAAKDIRSNDPTQLIQLAVKGMLPKNKLARQILGKLRVYAGDKHPHTAQIKKA